MHYLMLNAQQLNFKRKEDLAQIKDVSLILIFKHYLSLIYETLSGLIYSLMKNVNRFSSSMA